MSVVSLVILPVNAVCVVVQGDVVAAVRDIAGAQVMDEGDFTESVIFYFFRMSNLLGFIPYLYLDFQLVLSYLPIVFFKYFFPNKKTVMGISHNLDMGSLTCFYEPHYCEAGVTALVGDPQDAAVCHLVGVAIADHHRTVGVRSYHMPTGIVFFNSVFFPYF